MATLVLAIAGLWVLGRLARPLNWWKGLLVGAMVLGLILVIATPYGREFFALDLPSWTIIVETLAISGAAIVLLEIVWHFSDWIGRHDHHKSLAPETSAE
jgi:cation-transporting ATPase E